MVTRPAATTIRTERSRTEEHVERLREILAKKDEEIRGLRTLLREANHNRKKR